MHLPDVVILEADGSAGSGRGYGCSISERLIELGYTCSIISLEEKGAVMEELPPRPVIISGGMTEVTSNIDWVTGTRNLVRKRLEHNKSLPPYERYPVLGICFGAQIIAESYRQNSVTCMENPQIGVSRIRLNDKEHPLFQNYSSEFEAYSFHYNQISIHDPKVNLISVHRFAEKKYVQAFAVEESSCYGVQFHPEFSYEEYLALLAHYEDFLQHRFGLEIDRIRQNLQPIKSNRQIFKNYMRLLKSHG